MKLPNLQAYDRGHTELCERALVTVWNLLDDYREHLVLIGGLAPRYLCREGADSLAVNTMDVDLGLAIGVRGTAHNRIAARMADSGFKTKPEELSPGALPLAKFYRQFPGLELTVEYLADRPTPGSQSVLELDNMLVPTQPGIGRALAVHQLVEIKAVDLFGVERTCAVKVCEVGPFLCLKLRACGADAPERHGKDAFDLIHAVQYYESGQQAALKAFAAERDVNPAFGEAVAVLKRKFKDENGPGPAEFAQFSLGGLEDQAHRDDNALVSEQQRQTAAFVAKLLLRAASESL